MQNSNVKSGGESDLFGVVGVTQGVKCGPFEAHMLETAFGYITE